jgi:hypothetical protein
MCKSKNDALTLDLFSELTAVVKYYRGVFVRKSLRQRKLDSMGLLNSAIDGNWQTAFELSQKTGIAFHQSVKLLQIAKWQYDIEVKHEEWIDNRKRKRSRALYRRKTDGMSTLLASIFGHRPIPVPTPHTVRIHICKDD